MINTVVWKTPFNFEISIADIMEGIYRHIVQMDLVVKMWPCRTATIAHQGDCFSLLYVLAFLYKGLLKVGIFCHQAVSVIDK